MVGRGRRDDVHRRRKKRPSIIGTGTEDHFCEAWGFDTVTNFPFYGVPYMTKQPDGWTQTSVYRLHIPDLARFRKRPRVTIEHGWHEGVTNDYSSMAHWYQREPIARRDPLPFGPDAQPRAHEVKSAKRRKSMKISATLAEPVLRRQGISARAMTTSLGAAYRGGIIRIKAPDQSVDIPVSVTTPARYRVSVRLYFLGSNAPVTIGLEGAPARTVERVSQKGSVVQLGATDVGQDATLFVTVRSGGTVAIDYIAVDVIKP